MTIPVVGALVGASVIGITLKTPPAVERGAPAPPSELSAFEVPHLSWPPAPGHEVPGSSGLLIRAQEGAARERTPSTAFARTAPPVCTVRVVAPDPSVDPGMAIAATREVDPRMTIPSRCAGRR